MRAENTCKPHDTGHREDILAKMSGSNGIQYRVINSAIYRGEPDRGGIRLLILQIDSGWHQDGISD